MDAARPDERRRRPPRRPSRWRPRRSSGARWPRCADLDGVLAFADPQPLQPGSQGTLTWLPAEASTLRRGSIASASTTSPWSALSGGCRCTAQLRSGDDGLDVTPARAEPRRARLRPRQRDDRRHEFTAATERAVERLEKAHGLSAGDGMVDLDEVVYLPGGRGGSAGTVEVGARAGGKLYDHDRAHACRAHRAGRPQAVARPARQGGRGRAAGRRTAEGARSPRSAASCDPTERRRRRHEAVLDVEVTVVGNPGATDGAPVEVHVRAHGRARTPWPSRSHALLALAGGGYALELADSQPARAGRGRRRRRRLRPGRRATASTRARARGRPTL